MLVYLRLPLPTIYSWKVSIVLGAFNFSRYIFEELEIYHSGSSTTNFLHMDKSIVERNFRNAKYGRVFGPK